MIGGGRVVGRRGKKRGAEGGRYKRTLQIQLHTRGWDTHTCTHKKTYTLLVEHLNHISWMSVIHHSHRQNHMPERQGNCTETCITTHKQTRSRSSRHTLKLDSSVQEKAIPPYTQYSPIKNQLAITCTHITVSTHQPYVWGSTHSSLLCCRCSVHSANLH